ncbi:indole-3-glycerol phosphate synthase [Helicobacter sp. 11S02596-1]|uniref:indole-3-glycerol phosphate synthase n=1 Tax=Helicobacter sp. 11S02596-1 TaxID=1476194 RepID=UPI000BA655CE|nr:indole-3-glycerol phosphate synthase [Helicobacter sp. 11S02596-1]PAF44678.1 hypothetical protein BJI48_01410 [Helicobacter sp. 11S02596-1]
MKPYSHKSLENLKQSLKNKQERLAFDFLGRSLAYNPYMPRAEALDFKREAKQNIAGNILFCPPFSYEKLSFLPDNIKAIAIDFTPMYVSGVPTAEALDCLSALRRYSDKYIIHNDMFIDPYQLLESVVYGSDGVILEAGLLGKDLASMCDFASRLGLVVIVKITSPEELKAAIFAKAQILYIAKDFSSLLGLIPNSKIIFSDGNVGDDSVDLKQKNSYGVDMFLVRDVIK